MEVPTAPLQTTSAETAEAAVAGRPLAGQTWRLLRDGAHRARWNMAVDEAILDAVADGLAPPTLRLYRWSEAAVTVGRFQSVERGVDMAACRALGVPVVRRVTGGRGILHGGDLTVSVALPLASLGSAGASVAASYRLLSAGFVAALRRLGAAADLGACERREGRGGDCFAARSRADVVAADGLKLVGSAQRRTAGTLLQQSSLRHRPPAVRAAELFVGPTAAEVYPLAACAPEAVEQAVMEGFAEALGVRLNPGALTGWELERAGALLRDEG